MAQQDRVAVAGIETPPRLVRNDDLVERDGAVECNRPIEVEELPVTRGVTGMPCTARRPWLARHSLLLALVSWWTPHEGSRVALLAQGHIPAERDGTVGLPPRLPDRHFENRRSLVMRTVRHCSDVHRASTVQFAPAPIDDDRH
jgi:hypothetical protein